MKRTKMNNDDETRRKAGRPLTTVSPLGRLGFIMHHGVMVSSWCHDEKKVRSDWVFYLLMSPVW